MNTRTLMNNFLALGLALVSSAAVTASAQVVGTLASLPREFTFGNGTSCPMTGGGGASTAVIGYNNATTPDTGDTFTVTASGLPASSPVTMIIGKYAALRAPLAPTAIKGPYSRMAKLGCKFWTQPSIVVNGTSDALGNASLNFTIPTTSAGTIFVAQMIATNGTTGWVMTGALGFKAMHEISLRSVIGSTSANTDGHPWADFWHTTPVGFSYYVMPMPVTAPQLSKLKGIRLIGGTGNAGTPVSAPVTVSVWSSMAAALANYQVGDVYNVQLLPPSVPTAFGTSNFSFNGISYEWKINALQSCASLQLSALTTYYIGVSVDVSGGGTPLAGILETGSNCPSDTLIGDSYPSGIVISSVGAPFSSGCQGADFTATAS